VVLGKYNGTSIVHRRGSDAPWSSLIGLKKCCGIIGGKTSLINYECLGRMLKGADRGLAKGAQSLAIE
jgi:hypothetical protein